MTRVKRGTIAHKRREKILRYTKGFKWGRKSKERSANEALFHAWSYKFKSRKLKKRDFRKQWQITIGAALSEKNMSYSKFIGLLKKKKVALDRKILAELAEQHPEVFAEIVEFVK
ncbi:MAG: 50S ribosomal protein L20 [bacterium]|nr:50S ribosomal protein L20 [bacterium]